MKVALVNQPQSTLHEWPTFWTEEVAARLARSCDVVVYTGGSAPPATERLKGVTYRHITLPANPIPALLTALIERLSKIRGAWRLARKLNTNATSMFFYLQYSLAVARDLRSQHCDVVHLHHYSQFAPVIRLFNRRVKIVLHMHNRWLVRMDHGLVRRRLRGVALVLGCSDYVTEAMQAAYPNLAKRFQTLHYGTNVLRFAPRDKMVERNGTTRLLFVGRISPEKGLHVLVDALREVIAVFPHVQLEILGPPDQLTKQLLLWTDEPETVSAVSALWEGKAYLSCLKEQVSSLGLEPWVAFPGALPPSGVAEHYRAADVYIQPSIFEAFGIPVMEAMASGLPVVASRVGGIPEIVQDGKTGLLFERGDSAGLASAILRLLADDQLRRSMGNAGRQRALAHFSWEKATENLLYHYKDICHYREQ